MANNTFRKYLIKSALAQRDNMRLNKYFFITATFFSITVLVILFLNSPLSSNYFDDVELPLDISNSLVSSKSFQGEDEGKEGGVATSSVSLEEEAKSMSSDYVSFLYGVFSLDKDDEEAFILDDNASFVQYDGYYKNIEFQTYRIKKGDNLEGIARRFDTNIDTIISFNKIEGARYLQIDAILVIPSIKGILHTVVKGDNLDKIAKKYKVRLNDIAYINDLHKLVITPGERLFIPGASLPPDSPLRLLKDIFARPASGVLTSGYGIRKHPILKRYKLHTGLDIKAKYGSPVRAAKSGRVTFVGWKGAYGKLVILSHGNGLTTWYGHLSRIRVRRGQRVKVRQLIGNIGSTGLSTGPHLHFEVRKNNKPKRVLKKFRGLHGRIGGYW